MANARTKAMKSQQKQNKQANLAKRKRKQVEKKRGGKSPRKFVRKPVAPASVTSAYIATRIQSIFLFNIRLHYTKSLSLRIEFCTFCAAGARLTSDIISTHPQLTHPPLLFGSTLGLIRL